MNRVLRYTLIPAVAALAAFFAVLPHTGGAKEIDMVAVRGGFAFRPSSVRLDAGERVAFTNESKRTHTPSCSNCPWDTGDVQPGQTKFVSFGGDGTFSFACRYHGAAGMTGTIAVGAAASPSPSPAPSPSPSPG